MEITAHFTGIREIIIENLKRAKKEICIAVAWFTNSDIFSIILEKAKVIAVSLVIVNGDINNRLDGLDFQKFIKNGGKFFYGRTENPMHNKFCIIDSQVLITGSYNYTYLAESINSENIIIFRGFCDIINSYHEEFNRIISELDAISSVQEYIQNSPSQEDQFSFNNYGVRDTYQQSQELKKIGLNQKALSIINKLERFSKQQMFKNFQINNVIYKQWKQEYYARKIQVLNDKLILHYRTITSGGCWVHGPGLKYSWFIRDSVQRETSISTYEIKNIRINNKLIIDSLADSKIIYFSGHKEPSLEEVDLGYEKNENGNFIMENGHILPIELIKVQEQEFELTCDVYFNVQNFPLETIDLIEGRGTENKENHWHCLDINLKLNRESL